MQKKQIYLVLLLLVVFVAVSSGSKNKAGGHHKKKNSKKQKETVDQIQTQLLENLKEDIEKFVIPNRPAPIDQLQGLILEGADQSLATVTDANDDMGQFAEFTQKVISEVEHELINQQQYPDKEELEFLENIKQLVVQPGIMSNSHQFVITPTGGYNFLNEIEQLSNTQIPPLQKLDFNTDESPLFNDRLPDVPFIYNLDNEPFDPDFENYLQNQPTDISNSQSVLIIGSDKIISEEEDDIYQPSITNLKEEIKEESNETQPFEGEVNLVEKEDEKAEVVEEDEVEGQGSYEEEQVVDEEDQEDERRSYFEEESGDKRIELTLEEKNQLFAELGGLQARYDLNVYEPEEEEGEIEIKKMSTQDRELLFGDFSINPESDKIRRKLPNIIDDVENVMEELLATGIEGEVQRENQHPGLIDDDFPELMRSQLNKREVTVDEIVQKNQILEKQIAKEVDDIQKLIDEIEVETKYPIHAPPDNFLRNSPPIAKSPQQPFHIDPPEQYDIPMYETARETIITIDSLTNDQKKKDDFFQEEELEQQAEYLVLEKLEQKIYQAEKAKEEGELEAEKDLKSLSHIEQKEPQNFEPELLLDLLDDKNVSSEPLDPNLQGKQKNSSSKQQNQKHITPQQKEFLTRSPVNSQEQIKVDIKKVAFITAALSIVLVIFLRKQANKAERSRNTSREDDL